MNRATKLMFFTLIILFNTYFLYLWLREMLIQKSLSLLQYRIIKKCFGRILLKFASLNKFHYEEDLNLESEYEYINRGSKASPKIFPGDQSDLKETKKKLEDIADIPYKEESAIHVRTKNDPSFEKGSPKVFRKQLSVDEKKIEDVVDSLFSPGKTTSPSNEFVQKSDEIQINTFQPENKNPSEEMMEVEKLD